jgi:flagellar biosynthesis protein FliQ
VLDSLVELIQQGFATSGIVLAVPLLVGLVVAVLIATLQTVTSLHDPTIAMVPKFLAIGATLAVMTPWVLAKLAELAVQMWVMDGVPMRAG